VRRSSRAQASVSYANFFEDQSHSEDSSRQPEDTDDDGQDAIDSSFAGRYANANLLSPPWPRFFRHNFLPQRVVGFREVQFSNGTVQEQFLVKYRGCSFLHCDWMTQDQLLEVDGHGSTKIAGFWRRADAVRGAGTHEPDEHLDPAQGLPEGAHVSDTSLTLVRLVWLLPERILDEFGTVLADPDEVAAEADFLSSLEEPKRRSAAAFASADGPETYRVRRFLVKWEDLDHAEASWEDAFDIDDDSLILQYRQRERLPDAHYPYGPYRAAFLPPDAAVSLAKEAVDGGASGQALLRGRRPPASSFAPLPDHTQFPHENALRSYQTVGVNWLVFNWQQARCSLLADQMGTGKTCQSIAMLAVIARWHLWMAARAIDPSLAPPPRELPEGSAFHDLLLIAPSVIDGSHHSLTGPLRRGPFLVVAPLSTLGHWSREFHQWTDFNVVEYHGSRRARVLQRIYDWDYSSAPHPWPQGLDPGAPVHLPSSSVPAPRPTGLLKWDVLLTTYETLLQDADTLCAIRWASVVVDEAHRLKNRDSRLYAAMRRLPREHCVFLSGTPLQNDTGELFALLHFLDPATFSDASVFAAQFGDLTSADQVASLHSLLRPLMLRREKQDVVKSIPRCQETLVEVELTAAQKRLYRAILDRNLAVLRSGPNSRNIPNLVNLVMQIRKICNHPFLLEGAEERLLADAGASSPRSQGRVLVESCSKMVFLAKLLARLRAQGQRVLIFSQMVRVLDVLEDFCRFNLYPFERIDGSVRGNARQAAIDRFSKPGSDRFVFLLCTRAGGLGINLTSATNVVLYDSDFNPQGDAQAMARAHRIGQTEQVRVYRLISRGTYEEVMLGRANRKLGLDRAVIQGLGADAAASSRGVQSVGGLSRTEIDRLLRFGAHDVLGGLSAEAADATAREHDDQFRSLDLDEILAGSAVAETSVDSADRPVIGDFSTATFVSASSGSSGSVSLDDPDFWDKMLPEAASREEVARLAPMEGPGAISDRLRGRTAPEPEPAPSSPAPSAGTKRGRSKPPPSMTISERTQIIRALDSTGLGRPDLLLERCATTRGRTSTELNGFARMLLRLSIACAVYGAETIAKLASEAGNFPKASAAGSTRPCTGLGPSSPAAVALCSLGELLLGLDSLLLRCSKQRRKSVPCAVPPGLPGPASAGQPLIFIGSRQVLPPACASDSGPRSARPESRAAAPSASSLDPDSLSIDLAAVPPSCLRLDAFHSLGNRALQLCERALQLTGLYFVCLIYGIEIPPISLTPDERPPHPSTADFAALSHAHAELEKVLSPVQLKPLAVGWLPSHNSDLIVGTVRHGIGRFDALLTDPLLSFCHLATAPSNAQIARRLQVLLNILMDDVRLPPRKLGRSIVDPLPGGAGPVLKNLQALAKRALAKRK
jgi:superfamily II DNA or RNA helicase